MLDERTRLALMIVSALVLVLVAQHLGVNLADARFRCMGCP